MLIRIQQLSPSVGIEPTAMWLKATHCTGWAKIAPKNFNMFNPLYYLNYVNKCYLLSFLGRQPESNQTKPNTHVGYLLSVRQHCLEDNNTIFIAIYGNENETK